MNVCFPKEASKNNKERDSFLTVLIHASKCKSCENFGFFHCFYIQYVNEYSVNYPIAYAKFYPG